MINVFVLDKTDLKFQFLIKLFEETIPFISKRRTPPVVTKLSDHPNILITSLQKLSKEQLYTVQIDFFF